MNPQTLTRDLEVALAGIPILDVHTFLVGGRLGARGLHDILLHPTVVSDLFAAGCFNDARLTQFPHWPMMHEAHGRIWEAIPFLPHIQNTTSFWAIKIILTDLYHWDKPIPLDKWPKLDTLIRERADDRAWHHGILDRLFVQRSATGLARRGPGKDDARLQYTLEGLSFTRCQRGEFDTALRELERGSGHLPTSAAPEVKGQGPLSEQTIRTLDEVQAAIASYVNGIPFDQIISISTCFSTDIDYASFSDLEMDAALSRRGQAGPAERDTYASYINEAFLTALEKRNAKIVLQFSFGAELLPHETGSRLSERTIAQLGEMIGRHPRLRFQCLWASRHATESLCTLARSLPNLSLAGYGSHSFFPEVIRRVIAERLDMLPTNKQIGFFSGAHCVEWTYAKIILFRKQLARVLAEKIEQQQFNLAEALAVTRAILFESPQSLLGMVPRSKE